MSSRRISSNRSNKLLYNCFIYYLVVGRVLKTNSKLFVKFPHSLFSLLLLQLIFFIYTLYTFIIIYSLHVFVICCLSNVICFVFQCIPTVAPFAVLGYVRVCVVFLAFLCVLGFVFFFFCNA